MLAGVAYYLLTLAIVAVNQDTGIKAQLGRDLKGKASLALYMVGIALAFIDPLLAYGAYTLVPIMWLVPDRRFAPAGNEPD